MMAGRHIVSLADRPELAPVVAGWIWQEFWQGRRTLAQVEAMVAPSTRGQALPQCFVLLQDDAPVGTASLVEHDNADRPELTPWLAAVYVRPESRGQGHAGALVRSVERAAQAAGFTTLWLDTSTAERIYARAGWAPVGAIFAAGKPDLILMRRDLAPV